MIPLGVLQQQSLGGPSTLLDGLTSWYMMEEPGTDTRVDSHSGWDMVAGSAALRRTGQVGYGLDLTNTPLSYVWASGHTEKHNITGDFSAACWIEADSFPTYWTPFGIVDLGTPGQNWGYTLFGSGSSLSWYVMSGGSYPSVAKTLSTGVRYCIYVEYNSSTGLLGMSVDDETLVTTAVGTPNLTLTKILSVGTWPGLNRNADCMLDELAIWRGRILTTAERTEYNTGVTYTGLS